MQADISKQWRELSRGLKWLSADTVYIRQAEAFWTRCRGLTMEAGSPTRKEDRNEFIKDLQMASPFPLCLNLTPAVCSFSH
ncbi:hypothetical protein SKAU_G00143470 [Synaphobranchus kaupii]|uniref:Uncharacterized protein n=1 Tax=Synaphobranchus kaupii TaxID=118154 RepID=A0A9Q1FSN1_SYNKA|nr:hypothetical protein SKAU_G00143470 [Synaphobranchus kaupii]